MAEMPAASAAMYFGTRGEPRFVHRRCDGLRQRREETGPARARIELGIRSEQFLATPCAGELAGALFPVERTGARTFSAVIAKDAILFGREHLSPLCFA